MHIPQSGYGKSTLALDESDVSGKINRAGWCNGLDMPPLYEDRLVLVNVPARQIDYVHAGDRDRVRGPRSDHLGT